MWIRQIILRDAIENPSKGVWKIAEEISLVQQVLKSLIHNIFG